MSYWLALAHAQGDRPLQYGPITLAQHLMGKAASPGHWVHWLAMPPGWVRTWQVESGHLLRELAPSTGFGLLQMTPQRGNTYMFAPRIKWPMQGEAWATLRPRNDWRET